MATSGSRKGGSAGRRSMKTVETNPPEIPGVTPAGPIDTAEDSGGAAPRAEGQPNYNDIAQAAYMRYLNRGGSDGGDFEDWIAAERELAERRGQR